MTRIGRIACVAAAVAALAGEAKTEEPAMKTGWRQEFETMPSGWKVKGKPGTPNAVFTVGRSAEGTNTWLNMAADKASASLVVELPWVKLKDTPILRWAWRVTTFPEGADGRESAKDDQAIGVYVSTGGMFSQQSLAFRWETETPVGAEGTATYAGGVVKVKWLCLRNKASAQGDSFLVEERNVAEDFKSRFGSVPDKIGLSISCNSQYTGTKAEAQLAWIEFVTAPASTNAPAP
jgi:hypothetical protein